MEDKVLIVGGYGLVGTELYLYLKQNKVGVVRSHHKVVIDPTHREKRCHINLMNETTFGMALAEIKPTIVYLCAAVTDVDKCEIESYAFDVNMTGTRKFIEECHRRDIRVVFYSSSYVFDGEKKGSYSESDFPRPINKYGLYKMEIEGYVLYKDGVVIRTIGVFGEDKKNFRSRILASQKLVPVPTDQYMNPIHARDLARLSVEIEQTGYSGIINIAGNVALSKYEWAKSIRQVAELYDNIVPVSQKTFHQTAKRPVNGILSINKLIEITHSIPQVNPELILDY